MMKHICFEIYRQIKNAAVILMSSVGVGNNFENLFSKYFGLPLFLQWQGKQKPRYESGVRGQ